MAGLTIRNVPEEVRTRLRLRAAKAGRSALEWILDQYKEKKPKDPTIREEFNTCRFTDYKEKVIDLLQRVTTVSTRPLTGLRVRPHLALAPAA